MTLNSWQQRLTDHFGALCEKNSANGVSRPIFALEHGLADEELSDLTAGLREHTRWTGPANQHWLVWIVYAAEVGYKFAGDQYWQTFAEALPDWRRNGDGDFIKHAFADFGRKFNGAQPSGRFASHFTIICWPITHAILPKDLQRHLASVLYDVRQSFTPSLMASPTALGTLLDANSGRTNSRFRQLSGQHGLLGQIASALLLSEREDTSGLILASTLKRITSDLQAEQKSRDWLKSAKQRAETVSITGVRPGFPTGFPRQSTADDSRRPEMSSNSLAEVESNKLRLFVRQEDARRWSFRATLPNFGVLTRDRPELKQAFATQRSYFSGASDAFFPEKFLLYGRQEIEFSSIPDLSAPLLKLEYNVPGLTEFLSQTCSLPMFMSLLFRLNGDRTSTYLASGVIRPGRQYLYLTRRTDREQPALQASSSVEISCNGMRGLLIDVPERPSSIYRETARDIGLLVASGLSVHPVGYPAISWDGDGYGVWSEKGPKTLRVTADFEVTQFTFTLQGSTMSDVKTISSPTSKDVLIDLDVSEVGDYKFHITAVIKEQERPLSAGLFVKVIPLPDKAIEREQPQGFAVLTSPQVPTLEELWNDDAQFDIYGPPQETLACRLTFFEDSEQKISRIYHGPPLTLPVDAFTWRRYLADLKAKPIVQTAFDDSLSCTICFRSVRLGQFELHCDREFVPFRWIRRQKNSGYRLRLVQNDSDEPLVVQRYEFASPAHFEVIASIPDEGFPVGKSGGLFVATRGNNTASIVVPASQMGLEDLRSKVSRIPAVKTPDDLIRLVATSKSWAQAQAVGDVISGGKRNDALVGLRSCLIETLCGGTWLSTEDAVEHGRKPLSALSELLRSHQCPTLARSAFEHRDQFKIATPTKLIDIIHGLFIGCSHDRSHADQKRDLTEKAAITSLISLLTYQEGAFACPSKVSVEEASFWLANPTLARLVRFSTFASVTEAIQRSTSVDGEAR